LPPEVNMNRLSEIEAMYEMLDDTGRDYLCGMARQLLRSFPSNRTLRATRENVGNVQLVDHESDCAVYQFPLVGVGEAIDGKKADLG
jgi:hypothetical protein